MPPYANQVFNYKQKNRRKMISIVLQLALLALISVVLVRTLLITSYHQSLSAEMMTNTDGFIALSYFGVDRNGSPKYISKGELEKQLTALKEQGYETISQQQVIDFYEKGVPLPEKALFLSFEDGRTDSSLYSQAILEKLNYQATMFTYADKMDTKDAKFLKSKHLKPMIDSGYWELGSNGYRLTYINVFNGDGAYLGEIAEHDVPDKTTIEFYNHYLMDFLRDEYLIPKETRQEMTQRIASDYEQMHKIYTNRFTTMPKAYAIMHSNALYNNMHPAVQAVNDEMIKTYFALHFNRDLHAYNSSDGHLYDLNRLQVSPRWPVNHLLMRIKEDAKADIRFETGDAATANKWSIHDGVAQFDDHAIVLTTEPGAEVKAALQTLLPADFTAGFRMKGSVVGRQFASIANEEGEQEIQIVLEKNKLYVYTVELEGAAELLLEQSLDPINWSGEDYAFNKATHYSYTDTQQGSRIDEEEFPSTLHNDRAVTIMLAGDTLQIKVDHKLITDLRMPFTSSRYQLSLGGSSAAQQTAHEQYVDTIYDSIFEDLTICSDDQLIYSVQESLPDAFIRSVSKKSSQIIDFFIKVF